MVGWGKGYIAGGGCFVPSLVLDSEIRGEELIYDDLQWRL